MTGFPHPEAITHARDAERLLNSSSHMPEDTARAHAVAKAQVHATLALVYTQMEPGL